MLAGCCATHHLKRWEYKVADVNRLGLTRAEILKQQEALMNELGKDSWIFVSQFEADGTLCFKRPLKQHVAMLAAQRHVKRESECSVSPSASLGERSASLLTVSAKSRLHL